MQEDSTSARDRRETFDQITRVHGALLLAHEGGNLSAAATEWANAREPHENLHIPCSRLGACRRARSTP